MLDQVVLVFKCLLADATLMRTLACTAANRKITKLLLIASIIKHQKNEKEKQENLLIYAGGDGC